jgi:hypothetical protein
VPGVSGIMTWVRQPLQFCKLVSCHSYWGQQTTVPALGRGALHDLQHQDQNEM